VLIVNIIGNDILVLVVMRVRVQNITDIEIQLLYFTNGCRF